MGCAEYGGADRAGMQYAYRLFENLTERGYLSEQGVDARITEKTGCENVNWAELTKLRTVNTGLCKRREILGQLYGDKTLKQPTYRGRFNLNTWVCTWYMTLNSIGEANKFVPTETNPGIPITSRRYMGALEGLINSEQQSCS